MYVLLYIYNILRNSVQGQMSFLATVSTCLTTTQVSRSHTTVEVNDSGNCGTMYCQEPTQVWSGRARFGAPCISIPFDWIFPIAVIIDSHSTDSRAKWQQVANPCLACWNVSCFREMLFGECVSIFIMSTNVCVALHIQYIKKLSARTNEFLSHCFYMFDDNTGIEISHHS